jgi:hypothetical protein
MMRFTGFSPPESGGDASFVAAADGVGKSAVPFW